MNYYILKLQSINKSINLKKKGNLDDINIWSHLFYLPAPENISLLDRIKVILFCRTEEDKIKYYKPYYDKMNNIENIQQLKYHKDVSKIANNTFYTKIIK